MITAILFGGGGLLGAAALAVDVGQLWAEREQLQSGASSVALGLAKTCAQTPSSCGTKAAAAATDPNNLANQNAKDGKSAITLVCGYGPGLSTCPAADPGTHLSTCLGSTTNGTNYVEVHTATLQSNGSTLLPPSFSRALAGNSGGQGKTVKACARAAWGSPYHATGIAVTLSICEWNQYTSNGTVYQSRPDVSLPPTSAEKIIYLHSTTGATTCPAGPSGWDAPGGFGWLDENAGACSTTVSANGTLNGNTGASTSSTCQSELSAARAGHAVLEMPIYDGVTGTGASTTYHLVGFSAFVLTGYALPGFTAASWLSGSNLCHGSEKCLYGYFTRGLVASGTALSGNTNYGASAVISVG